MPSQHAPITSESKLDLLFMIDDSASMAPLQAKLRQRLADFMLILKSLPGGMPSLHIAVVSSSLGAGIFNNVPGCFPGSVGNTDGIFQRPEECSMLTSDARFIIADRGTNNFSGDIADVFGCMTNLGQGGCGFEHQFESIRFALQRSQRDGDANSGFLRSDAFLGIVMLTNEDDCSVPVESTIFDPVEIELSDPLGGLQSYRCNEFGHKCSGKKPPHAVTGEVTLTNCESAEDGPLISVAGMAEFLKSLKADPSRVFIAALAGPTTPYTIRPVRFQLPNGLMELQPQVVHSCAQTTTGGDVVEYADPAIRVAQLIRAFGPNGVFETICSDDFKPAMENIGHSMVGMMKP